MAVYAATTVITSILPGEVARNFPLTGTCHSIVVVPSFNLHWQTRNNLAASLRLYRVMPTSIVSFVKQRDDSLDVGDNKEHSLLSSGHCRIVVYTYRLRISQDEPCAYGTLSPSTCVYNTDYQG